MPVLIDEAVPHAVAEILQQVRTNLATFRTPRLSGTDPETVILDYPHRFAALELEPLQDDRLPLEPEVMGFRIIVLAKDREPLAAIEVIPDEKGGCRLGGINEGPLVDGFVKALKVAEELPNGPGTDFEPQLLLVLALNVAALRLALDGSQPNKFGPNDLLLPLPLPVPNPPFEPLRPIGVDAFLEVSRRLARDVPVDSATGG